MTAPDSSYAKPFLTVPEQIRQLRKRGMDCGTDAYASAVLGRHGYYRLSGYWHLYRMRPVPPAAEFDSEGREVRLDSFVEGTSLRHVVDLYNFDQELRARLGNALSTIEVSLRFFIGHRVGKIDRFAHRDPHALGAVRAVEPDGSTEPITSYIEWLEEFDRHESRAKDRFVVHFREKYGPHLPIWVATEVMSFGLLSNLYLLMPQVDQEILAARFQVNTADGRGDRGAFANWLNNLRNVRNICAHYGRTWNRVFDVLIDAPGQSRKQPDDRLSILVDKGVCNRLHGVLVIMRHLLLSIDPQRSTIVDIADFIEKQSTEIGFSLSQLGFPDGWRTNRMWDCRMKLDHRAMLAADLLDRTEARTAVDTRAMLFGAEVDKSSSPRTAEQEERAKKAAQRQLLRTYIRYRVVIEIELGGIKFYPSFQFRDGKIINALAEINRDLSGRYKGDQPTDLAAAMLDWWQLPNVALPPTGEGRSQSPCDLLQALTEEAFATLVAEADATRTFVCPGRQ
ncbi:Abi family protein [Nocardia sp. NPDC127579]|uniref:Abi family protein n=1 Tax=Nocardia sp. NPDC127579 TaxID=3345402 RepID=UPI003635987F